MDQDYAGRNIIPTHYSAMLQPSDVGIDKSLEEY